MDIYIIYRVNQSCLIVCHQSYIIHKYAEHVEQNAAWEAVSRLPRVSDNIRHVHAAHTAIYSNHIMVLTWTGGFQLLGLEWPRLLVALGLLEPVWGMLSLKDMEWKPGSSISSCKYVCFGGLASSTELRCMEGALPWHCICWMINIYIYIQFQHISAKLMAGASSVPEVDTQ